ncbi:uncharacterized protein LOC121275259 [Carcharodon carcharias]|uniref:uncharacterized protein LOC121275259 n=1 Tax=Carcharodon carcharias TaxID=13397 RepID=UPI001B7F3003|nr:uncharacterized protein LOC121275259 [Carcharodon carcharias]
MGNANVSHVTVTWYKAQPGSSRELLITHDARNHVHRYPGVTSRFQPSRDVTNNSYVLTITGVDPSDVAIYICSVRGSSYGAGTLLNVTTTVQKPVLVQSPPVHSVRVGWTVSFQCVMGNANVSHVTVTWYKAQPGSSRELLITHDARNHVHRYPGVTSRFQPSRDVTNNSYVLTITGVDPSDVAIYICSVRGSSYGAGTLLNVTISNARMAGELRIVWISVGAALGALLIVGAALLFWVCPARTRKRQSSKTIQPTDKLPESHYKNISLPGVTQVSQKPKELRFTRTETGNPTKYQTTFVPNQNLLYNSFEPNNYSNVQLKATEPVPAKSNYHRGQRNQQLRPTQLPRQHESAPRCHRQSTLRRFIAFKNLAAPTSSKTVSTPACEDIYANQSQIRAHLLKEKSTDPQMDSNSIYMNFDPRY